MTVHFKIGGPMTWWYSACLAWRRCWVQIPSGATFNAALVLWRDYKLRSKNSYSHETCNDLWGIKRFWKFTSDLVIVDETCMLHFLLGEVGTLTTRMNSVARYLWYKNSNPLQSKNEHKYKIMILSKVKAQWCNSLRHCPRLAAG